MHKTFVPLLALVLGVLGGCRATRPKPQTAVPPSVRPEPVIFVADMASEMGFRYTEDPRGFLELRLGPDAVVLTPGSRRAMVNGHKFYMVHPCLKMGDNFALRTGDARMLRQHVRGEQVRPVPLARPAAPVQSQVAPLPAGWAPHVAARHWRHIVIHHTVTSRGSVVFLDRIHRARGFDSLGYHFVIGNGAGAGDGEVQVGSRWAAQKVGAHTRVDPSDDNYWNRNSIGIVLVGDFTQTRPSRRQMDSLVLLVRTLENRFQIAPEGVIPHRAVKGTLCPGTRFPWAEFQQRLR